MGETQSMSIEEKRAILLERCEEAHAKYKAEILKLSPEDILRAAWTYWEGEDLLYALQSTVNGFTEAEYDELVALDDPYDTMVGWWENRDVDWCSDIFAEISNALCWERRDKENPKPWYWELQDESKE